MAVTWHTSSACSATMLDPTHRGSEPGRALPIEPCRGLATATAPAPTEAWRRRAALAAMLEVAEALGIDPATLGTTGYRAFRRDGARNHLPDPVAIIACFDGWQRALEQLAARSSRAGDPPIAPTGQPGESIDTRAACARPLARITDGPRRTRRQLV